MSAPSRSRPCSCPTISATWTATQVGRFAQILYENIGWLRENGHPKWKSVDLDFALKGWEQYDCVRRYLVKKGAPAAPAVPRPAGEINPIMEAVKDILNR